MKSDTVTYAVPAKTGLFDAYWIVNVQPEGGHEFVAMELCSNRAMLPQLLKGEPLELGKKHAFTVKQPELPALDRPEVRGVKVEANMRIAGEVCCSLTKSALHCSAQNSDALIDSVSRLPSVCGNSSKRCPRS